MSKTIKPDQLEQSLRDILYKFDAENLESADKVTAEAARNMYGAIIEGTPVAEYAEDKAGRLKGSWVLTTNSPSTSYPVRYTPDRTRSSLKIPKNIASKNIPVFMTSNSPYVNTVEYGGYTKNPKRGTWNPQLGRYQIRSSGGFSKQAPEGMVRRNTQRWNRFVEIAANKIL